LLTKENLTIYKIIIKVIKMNNINVTYQIRNINNLELIYDNSVNKDINLNEFNKLTLASLIGKQFLTDLKKTKAKLKNTMLTIKVYYENELYSEVSFFN
jgi:hypothetical protein